MDKEDQVPEEKWQSRQAAIRQRWSKLGEDQLENTQGDKDQIVQLLEKEYGYSEVEAQKEYEDFIAVEDARRKLHGDLIEDTDKVYD